MDKLPVTAWAANAQEDLRNLAPIAQMAQAGINFECYLTNDSLWLVAEWENKEKAAFRMAFAPADHLSLGDIKHEGDLYTFYLDSSSLDYTVTLEFPNPSRPLFHFRAELTPSTKLLIPYWPKDIIPLQKNGQIKQKGGKIHAAQVGTRSGILYFTMEKPATGSVFYFQNLTALNDYCELTKTSAGGLVGGVWPELGFSLPGTMEEALPAGQMVTVSDAYVLLTEEVPATNIEICRSYLDNLAAIYTLIPKPDTEYHDWLDIGEKGLADLVSHKGCWTHADGNQYLNAYVSDYKSPPEIMVQLAVLLPMIEYGEWKGKHIESIEHIKRGLPAFYDETLKTVVRWLPAKVDNLDGSEEQKQDRVMDSWYLHHPLMNLARLAVYKDKKAEELLLGSVDYVIKVAKHFNYQWPVFYKMDTLEVVKAETQPGAGGEMDVPGAYAKLMIETWMLTKDKRYLNEAKRAVKKLDKLSFDLFYQGNNTAFAAVALLRLYKETGDEHYLDLSYVCIAAIINNVQLWDCNYGNAKYYPTFFAIFPLRDAPYTAAYEEQEVYSTLHGYLEEARDIELPDSVKLLLSEMIKYVIARLPYYYPPMLPEDLLSEEVNTGEIDPNLWVALEDLQDGWNKSGTVGQEVYGAGIAFGVLPRQYFKIPGEDFLLFTDYPVKDFRTSKKRVTLHTDGSEMLGCRLRVILPDNDKKKYKFTLSTGKGKQLQEMEAIDHGNAIEYALTGNQLVKLEW
ncbi:hypothetical protein [Pedobacter deserti]|uniref:hypothetical protein n=1 Tax=Pedobacter deserti TaxID=2817382 RepID=UPI002109161C|nr:hypothetical protein [Pedobacter sp. SYSU D00382]